MLLLRRREWDRRIQTGDADDGAVEIVEGFFVDNGGDFTGEASGAGVLVQDDDFVRLLYRLRYGFAVERGDGAQIEEFLINSLSASSLCGFERRVDHRSVGDDAEIAAFADDVCFADWDDIIFRGNFALDAAVEIFVLEEDAGIVVANGGFDQALGIVGRGGADDFEAGIVDEPHLGILGVERTAVDVSAAGSA